MLVLLAAWGAGSAWAEALDADLIHTADMASLRPAVSGPSFRPAVTSTAPADAPVAPSNTEGDAELTISTDLLDFEPVQVARVPVFGVLPDDNGGVPEGAPAAPSSGEADRIRARNEDAKQWATKPGYFKFIVDKDSSRMAVFDGVQKVGVFNVSFGSNASDDSYGTSGNRNTPIGVFICHAGRASEKAFTWFIPYDVPGRNAMGIHGPKDVFLGGLLGLIHWTAGCIAMHSRDDILTIKAAHAVALKRGTPTRLIIGRGLDFRKIPGW